MAARPHLVLESPQLTRRHELPSRPPGGFGGPQPTAQRSRLNPQLRNLVRAFNAGRMELTADPGTADAEQVVVLEVADRRKFVSAVRNTPGIEWLGETDVLIGEVDDEFAGDDTNDAPIPGRLYLVMSNVEGIRELVRLWRLWRSGDSTTTFPRGLTPWREVFSFLHEIRLWGPEDRIDREGLRLDLARSVAARFEVVDVEVELWFRDSAEERVRASASAQVAVNALNGRVLQAVDIPAAAYQAVLAEVPLVRAQAILELNDPLVRSQHVMRIRPGGQFARPVASSDFREGPPVPRDMPPTAGDPLIAVLDGLPLEDHSWLTGRLSVDDPDGWAATYEASRRAHGTSMVSLVAHGDLEAALPPHGRPIYTRPVLRPVSDGWGSYPEQIPVDEVPADLINRAVTRLFDGARVAPTVKVISHSIADAMRPFEGGMSGWARVIDALAWEHRVLFVVSAGNYSDDIEIAAPPEGVPLDVETGVIKALGSLGRERRLLAPSEAINALTVGAAHHDSSADPPPPLVDPFGHRFLPSPISAQGRGFRRAIKPEITFDAGRQTYLTTDAQGGGKILSVPEYSGPPGLLSAAPPARPGDSNRVAYTVGTSNSTALVARLAVDIVEMLADLRADVDDGPPATFDDVLTKAILVNSSRSLAMDHFRAAGLGVRWRSLLSRMEGFGPADRSLALASDDHRATLLGWGELADGEGHQFKIPLPPGLSGVVAEKTIRLTLAWVTPIAPSRAAYRGASLWLDMFGDDATAKLGEKLNLRRDDPDWQGVRRGTVQHEVLSGRGATAFAADEPLEIQVNCRSEVDDRHTKVPYGLVISIEARAETPIAVYEEIRARIRPRLTVRVGADAGQPAR